MDLRPAIDAPSPKALGAPAPGWAGGTGPNELTALINRLNHVRRGSRALCHGGYRNVVITNRQLLFERAVDARGDEPTERVLVAVNAEDAPFTFRDGELQGEFEVLVSCDTDGQDSNGTIELHGSLEIPSFGIMYLR